MPDRLIADITDFIFVADRPQQADVIFLPGGSYPELPERAAALYRAGFAPRLLPSGQFSVKSGRFPGPRSRREIYGGSYATECAFYTDVLVRNGVPPDAILPECRAGTTRENAFFSRKAADRGGLHVTRGIVVCHGFHARRCLMLYQLAFPGAELLICPVDCTGIDRGNWSASARGVDRVLGELARCGNQFVGEFRAYCLGGSTPPAGG